MTEQNLNQPASLAAPHRFLPVLLVLFVGSGCAALIYEIVWFQLLQLVIGSSAVSLGVLLGTFMGGMCVGSLVLPRLISARRHPLRVYALLELGIGLMGLAVLTGMPYVGRLYVANVGHGLSGILWRGAVCALCLLPPTLLMGATLPAIARWVETTPRGVSWLGFFYGGNIAGAVFGCLLAGFYLLRVHDMATATYVAATINAAVALAGLGLAALTRGSRQPVDASTADHRRGDEANESDAGERRFPASTAALPRAPRAWSVHLAIALSGMSALGAEVIWTRLLSLMLGATVYTFSIILAVFLLGLGIGSGLGSLLSRTTVRPRIALGVCQLLLAAAIAWTAYTLAKSLPYWPISPSLSTNPWFNFQLDLMRCIWAILPATCLWGASFPLALAAAASRGQDPGRLVGGVYAANTVGAILGAVAFSILLIGWAGTRQSQRLLIGLSALAAVAALAPLFWSPWATVSSRGKARKVAARIAGAAALVAALGLAGWLARGVSGVPWGLVAYGRYLPSWDGLANILYVGEGMNASIAVSELETGAVNFHVSGKVEASSAPQDMRLQRMLGHLPALFHPKPRTVLVVGCGAGVTAGSFVLHPDVEKIVICEIEPLIPQVVADYFAPENYDVLRDARVEVVYDDARHYVLTTREKFDIITSDPINPWVKGAATLYTREYFELVKRHLNPGGLVTQWVPLYESTPEAVKSELATFFEVFPGGTIWSNDDKGKGYDIVLLGQADATKIDLDELQERLGSNEYRSVASSLDEVGFGSTLDLLATYAGRGSDLGLWLKGAQINRDRDLRLQYLAGLGMNVHRSEYIFNDLVGHRKFPADLFVATERQEQALRKALASPGGSP